MRMHRAWLLVSTLLDHHDRSTASSLSRRSVVCSTARECGWSRTPSVSYGSPVCAFGAPQFGFGPGERESFRLVPVHAAPCGRSLPVSTRVFRLDTGPPPPPQNRSSRDGIVGGPFSRLADTPPPAPWGSRHVALTVENSPGPLGKMLLKTRGRCHPPCNRPFLIGCEVSVHDYYDF